MRLLILSIFIFTGFGSFSQEVFELKRSECPPHIGKFVRYYLDDSKTMKLENIMALSRDKFKLSEEDLLNFNITKSAIWCKMKFTCSEDADWLLNYKNSNNNKIDVFLFKGEELISKQHGGIPYPKNIRKLLGGHVLFDLPIKAGDTLNCLLRTNSGSE